MKTKLIALMSTAALVASSNGAVSLSGTALKNVQGTTSNDLASGMLALLVIDTDGDGFLGGYTGSAVATNPLTPKTDFSTTGAGLAVGSTFLGDIVAARLTTANALGDTSISGSLSNFDAASFLNKNYAIVWFNTLTTAGSETVGSGSFGIARGGDWTFPAANSGTFSFGTTASSLDQLTLGAPTTVPGGVGQSVAFASNGTTLSFVPEPSSALLGAIGALGLLRRRRI